MTEVSPSPILLVVAAALRRGDDRVLLQRRTTGALAGLWEFPGGKPEPGESAEAALVRELAEELAISVDPAHCRPVAFATGTAGDRPLVLLLFLVERWAGEPQPHVADALRWVMPEEMAALPMPAADYPLAERLALCLDPARCRD